MSASARRRFFGVTGSRTPTAPMLSDVKKWVLSLDKDVSLIHGDAVGVDSVASAIALSEGIECFSVRPPYDFVDPKLAPLVRNCEIAAVSEKITGFWHGKPFGGTSMTLWVFWYLKNKDPEWFSQSAESRYTFESMKKNPPEHWLRAVNLWSREFFMTYDFVSKTWNNNRYK